MMPPFCSNYVKWTSAFVHGSLQSKGGTNISSPPCNQLANDESVQLLGLTLKGRRRIWCNLNMTRGYIMMTLFFGKPFPLPMAGICTVLPTLFLGSEEILSMFTKTAGVGSIGSKVEQWLPDPCAVLSDVGHQSPSGPLTTNDISSLGSSATNIVHVLPRPRQAYIGMSCPR